MQIVDYSYFSTNYEVYCNKFFGNSIIYDVEKTLVKQPKYLDITKANYIQHKLELLQKNPSKFYIDVLELYGYLFDINTIKFFTYSMPKLEDNVLKGYRSSQYSMEEKNELLLKINELVTNGNKEGIYNHDIWLRNFHLDKYGKLTGLDVDSLAIGPYKSDIFFKEIANYKLPPQNIDNLYRQNISMLKCCFDLWCSFWTKTIHFSLHGYRLLIELLDIDPSLKQMMVDVFEYKDVDMKELISHMPNEGKYLKRSL